METAKLSPVDQWFLELERERYNTAWKTPKQVEPVVIVKTVEVVRKTKAAEVDKKAQRKRDKIMYHAGRFAAGMRDKEAVEGNKLMASYINGKLK